MNLFYECSDGTRFDLIDGDISCEKPETLLKRAWKYKTVSCINSFTKIKQFYKEAVELPLTISIMCDTEGQFNTLMEKLLDCFEKDISSKTPGKIYWNDYYKEVFIFASEPSEFEEYFAAVKQKLTLLSLYDYWIKENSFNYSSGNKVDFSQNADFPYEFGDFDYMPTDVIDVINIDGNLSVNFDLTFWGACANPYVIIGGNEYRINNIELADGEYITVSSKTRTVTKHNIDGSTENIFHLRDSNKIFTPLPRGKSIINRKSETQLSITTYTEKGEPVWI